MDAFWIILTGALVASCCALLGCFLLLRKMTMVGDAIAHAVLPGIVIAYLVSNSKDSFILLLGAGVFGVLTTFLIESFHKFGKMQEDSAIGISFTWLFSVGIILISFFANQVELDQDCVLYGEIAYIPLDTWVLANGVEMGPRHVWSLAILLICIVLFVYWGYKGLVITTFDATFASSAGISTVFWHYALMSMVSFTTVLSFEAVGAILVVAFLVGPALVAYLLTENLVKMLFIAVFVGILSAVLGYFLAVSIDGSIAGAMATVIGAEFTVVFLFKTFISNLFKAPEPTTTIIPNP